MRLFRMIATPVLLLGLLGFLIWGAQWGWRNLTAPLPSPTPTPCVTKEATVVTPANVSVNVFNGGFTAGLARLVGDHLTRTGFTVLRVANTDERVAETIVRGNEENKAALEMLQSHFVNSVIQFDDRIDGTVDVLVGTAWAGSDPNFLREVVNEGGVVCEHVSESPSPSPSPDAADGTNPAPSPSPTG